MARFASTIFECFVDWPTPPVYVSLVTRHCDSPTNILQVQNATKETSYEQHLTVCLPPLLLHYDKTTDFIKWLEINRQFGVDKFVVYKYSSGSNIDRVLEHYSERGLTEVVQWRPPMVDENFPREIQPVEIENYAQTVALNDCLYRNKKTSEFITNMGLNEYIISPFNNESTIHNMVNSLGINAAVYHVTKSILQKRLDKPKLKPKSKIIREKQKEKQKLNLQAVNDKPKLIIRTAEVEFSSMHHVPGVDSYMVPSEKALMHRNSGFGRNQTLVPKFDSVLSWKNGLPVNSQNYYSRSKGQQTDQQHQ
ncbi:uncharacterized protein LOC128554012, partial [Mercenaria mercenaria]|uniref:uncharacterized protein LOC128554012 n=1 Tax=Mercenaria mercenaria TaxID=6596 RepID=UPI00234E7BF4